eukprot:10141371-Alexandrium_andersonii.AAC.1
MRRVLAESLGTYSARIRRNMAARLDCARAPGGQADPMMYLERFGAFGEAPHGRHLGSLSWGLAHVLQAVWSGEHESAADCASLL